VELIYGTLFHINRFWPSNINLNKMGLAKAKVTNNEKDVDLELIYSSDFVIDVLFGVMLPVWLCCEYLDPSILFSHLIPPRVGNALSI
jgi:hypothetical protein